MDINEIQRLVLVVIGQWGRTEKSPIAQRVIIERIIEGRKVPESTIRAAVRVLCKKGYIRKAYTYTPGTCYVQLRTV